MRCLVLPALLVALAGCVAPAGLPEPGPPAPPPALWLDATSGLATSASGEEVRALGWGMPQWLEGIEAPAWTGPPAEAAYVLTSAVATVTYEALAPVATTGTRPELTVWFGVEDSVIEHGFADGPPALATGARTSATFELALPLGGLVVLPGERLVLRVGSYYTDHADRGAMAIVLGGEEGSRLELEAVPVTLGDVGSAQTVVEERVTLRGGRCGGLDAATEDDLAWLDLDVPAAARALEIVARRAEGAGPPDVDFVVLDAEGETVAHALGSAGVESVRLREPNLAAAKPGAWRLGVYACTPQSSVVDVVATLAR